MELKYRVEAKANQAATIYLYGSIGKFDISADRFIKDLKALGSVKKIDLYISSDGGDVFEGRAIYSQLVQHPARVIAHIDGLAASIASLIALAGNEVHMADGSFMMIHNAQAIGFGGAEKLRKLADLVEANNEALIDTYAAKTRAERETIKQWMDEETWMTANEAKERGFVDVVTEMIAMAAKLEEPNKFQRPPLELLPNRLTALGIIERGRQKVEKGKKSG